MISNYLKLTASVSFMVLLSCAEKENVATVAAKPKPTQSVAPVDTSSPKPNLNLEEIVGDYANKGGFSASFKVSEKDPSKLDFVFQLSRGCVRRYSGTAFQEAYINENELNYISKDSVNKVEIEISMFFSKGKVAIAERTSERKEKMNDLCVFEGHLKKLK